MFYNWKKGNSLWYRPHRVVVNPPWFMLCWNKTCPWLFPFRPPPAHLGEMNKTVLIIIFWPLKLFKKKIAENAFIEYEEVYPARFYGTLRDELQNKWSAGQHIVFDIDVVGGLNIKSQYPEQTLSIFIQAPNLKVLEERLRSRATEDEALIQERLAKAQLEMESATKFDVVIVNDDLEQAKKEMFQKVKAFLAHE